MNSNLTSSGISLVFFGMAGWFFWGSPSAEAPMPPVAQLQLGDLQSPTRALMGDPPTTDIGGLQMNCQDCHSLFESDPKLQRELFQHEHIQLNHGLNNRCLNCHSTADRNKLVLYAEIEIGFDEVQLLCAKCHGPTFRDWEKGMHGKTLGSWVSNSREQRRLKCTECHDPHSPAFEHIVPLPGPSTLRMGDPSALNHDDNKHNVLQLWRGQGSSHSNEQEHR